MVWTPVVEIIQKAIEEQGFFYCPYSFKKFAIENGMDAPRKTPQYVSIDFWSEQNKELSNRGWYVIRLSGGSFGIFSEEVFPKPYTELSTKSAEILELGEQVSRPHIEEAFKQMMDMSSAENTTLEMLRFGGIYDSFIERFSDANRYTVGPRGNFRQQFNLYMENTCHETSSFKYNGQTELDYSLWTDDRIFIVEAKSQNQNGLDIGWHKMAFPSQYYSEIAIKHGVEIIPVYLLRHFTKVDNVVYFFVFPPYEQHKGGLLLNAQNAMVPESVLKFDLSEIIPSMQQKIDSFTRV